MSENEEIGRLKQLLRERTEERDAAVRMVRKMVDSFKLEPELRWETLDWLEREVDAPEGLVSGGLEGPGGPFEPCSG